MALEEIKFGGSPETQFTALIHGDTGSGKTHFAASFPRPYFLSVNDEQGWETLHWMDPAKFYEPGRYPRVGRLKKAPDLVQGFNEIVPLVQSGEVKTIVVDSLTFWVEMFYDYLLAQSTTKNPLQVYGALGDHLRNIRIKFHQLGCNVLWLCLTRYPDKPGMLAMPEIKGRQGVNFPAGCRYVWHTSFNPNNGFELRTKMYGTVLARGRDGGRLPDPIKNPTYRLLQDLFAKIKPGSLVDKTEAELIAEVEAPNATDEPGLGFLLDGLASPEEVVPAATPKPSAPKPSAVAKPSAVKPPTMKPQAPRLTK